MGNCKNCFTTIPDGQTFCEECAKIKQESSESENYLDSLLNSVADIQDNEDEKVKRLLEKRKRKEQEQNENKKDTEQIANIERQDSNENSELPDYTEVNEENDSELDMGDVFSVMGSEDEYIEETNDDIKLDESEELDEELKAAMPEWENDLQMDTNEESEIELPIDDRKEESENELQMDHENESEDDINVNDLLDFMGEDNFNSVEEKGELDSLQDNNKEDDLSSEEILSLDDLLGSIGEDEEILNEQNTEKAEENIDLGTIFSDALGAVSDLEDSPEETEAASELIAAVQAKKEENKQKKKEKTKKEKQKKSIFEKLFANVIDEKDEKKFAKEQAEAEEKARIKKEKKQKKNNITEDGAVPKEKGIKGLLSMFKKDGKENEEKKAEKARIKEEKKRKKQEKKEKEIEKETEVEVYQGKINKRGAAFILTFFGLVTVGILAGTDIFSYSQGVALAEKSFKNKKYDVAYEEIQGLKVREKDTELAEQIMTVMFVNKQLNSYQNFYSRKDYAKALDSLLKGLKRYDKYIDKGKQLGVESDLNYVRSQIIEKLYGSFQLTEAEALSIIKSTDQTDYSTKIHSAVKEKVPQSKDGTK